MQEIRIPERDKQACQIVQEFLYKNHAPVSLFDLLDELVKDRNQEITASSYKRAIWSLVGAGKAELTEDWKLRPR